MAIKGDRWELQTDMSSICNDVIVKGQFLTWGVNPGASGIALDDANNIVKLTTGSPSGLHPAGMSLVNTVNIDTTRQHVNFMKDELVIGSHVTLLKQGWVVTDQILVGTSPLPGDKVFVAYSGLVTNFNGAGAYVGPVGEFGGGVDPQGFAKIYVHLPLLA